MRVPNGAVRAAQMAGLGRWQNKATIEAMLEAAAPHMLAEAWDAGAEAQAKGYGMDKDTGPNPYRTALEAADPTVPGTEPIG